MKYLLLGLFLITIAHCSLGQTGKPTLASTHSFEQLVAQKVRFPAVAQRLGKSVRVYVSFELTNKGDYRNVAVINDGPIAESLKEEINRLWHVLPRQDPNYAGNYVMPIAFLFAENRSAPLKSIANQDDGFAKMGSYVLLNEVSVVGYVVCELKRLGSADGYIPFSKIKLDVH